VNGVAVDPAGAASPELAAVRELLRQRAVALALLAEDTDDDRVTAAIEELLELEVATPTPTEAECRRYYDAHAAAFRSGDLVHARHILFQVAPGSRIDPIRTQAEETLAQLLAAPDEFEVCALTLSNCPSGLRGGNLGQIGRGDTVPEFEEALFAEHRTGILPRLVKTRHGFHIVAIDRRIDGELLPFTAVQQQIAKLLSDRVQAVALQQYVRLLAGRADVAGIELDAASIPLVQ
ncbi:MAG TPA: peptidylprolyl isomerase, partial [Stellaceae bacterium]|nr:peptidylprolyl isomerase [Stellaceae bacterium]